MSDNGIIGKLFAGIDRLKGNVKANTKRAVAEPQEFMKELLTDVIEQVKDPMNFVGGGAGVVKGNKALFATHQSSVSDILNALGRRDPILTAPSVAIGNSVDPRFGSVSLIPRDDVIDPAVGRVQLLNRDFFSSTSKVLDDVLKSFDEFGGRFAQMTPKQSSMTMAIAASPEFKSLLEAVSSPFGAGILKGSPTSKAEVTRRAQGLEQTGLSAQNAMSLVRAMEGRLGTERGMAQHLSNLMTDPSTYMEAKIGANVPITGDSFMAALLPSSRGMLKTEMQTLELEKLLQGKGIKTYRMDEAAADFEVSTVPDILKAISEGLQ